MQIANVLDVNTEKIKQDNDKKRRRRRFVARQGCSQRFLCQIWTKRNSWQVCDVHPIIYYYIILLLFLVESNDSFISSYYVAKLNYVKRRDKVGEFVRTMKTTLRCKFEIKEGKNCVKPNTFCESAVYSFGFFLSHLALIWSSLVESVKYKNKFNLQKWIWNHNKWNIYI